MTFWNSNDISFTMSDDKSFITLEAGEMAVTELKDAWKSDDDFHSDDFLGDITEDLTVNTEFNFTSNASSANQMSDAPMFYIPIYDEDDDHIIGAEEIYYFDNCRESVQERLMKYGECKFVKL